MDVALIRFRYSPEADRGVRLPERQTSGSSCYDLWANLRADDRAGGLSVGPGEFNLVPTGLILQLPLGVEALIRPRSGLALKHGVTVLNSPGTIDPDYRGEIAVLLVNHGKQPFQATHGQRIAQMSFQAVTSAQFTEESTLSDTERGAMGFGSSGSN